MFSFKRNRFAVVMLICLLLVVLTSCGTSTDKEPGDEQPAQNGTEQVKKEKVIIGLEVPLSGNNAFEGKSRVNAAQMAIDEINAAGGVAGYEFVLVETDSASKPDVAVTSVEKLITNDNINVLLTGDTSSTTKAVMPIAAKYKVPMIDPSSTAPSLTDGTNPYFFRVIPNDALLASGYSKFLAEDLGAKNVAFLARNDDFGRQAVERYLNEFPSYNINVAKEEYFQDGSTDYLAQLTKIKSSNADTLFIVAQAQDASVMIKQANELGYKGNIVGIGSLAADVFIEMAGEFANGVYCGNQYVYTIDTPENKNFVESYDRNYPGNPLPDKNVWGTYTSVYAYAKALEIAKTTDSDKIIDALKQVEFEGITGTIKFDDNGQAHPDIFVTLIENNVPTVMQQVSTKGF